MALNIEKIKPYNRNPRKITSAKKEELSDFLKKYGDLSGIVINIDGTIISGNQRATILDIHNCNIQITEQLTERTPCGTIAYGIIYKANDKNLTNPIAGVRFVDWHPEKIKKACVIANQAGGEFDFNKLAEEKAFFKEEILYNSGFSPEEIEEINMLIATTNTLSENDKVDIFNELITMPIIPTDPPPLKGKKPNVENANLSIAPKTQEDGSGFVVQSITPPDVLIISNPKLSDATLTGENKEDSTEEDENAELEFNNSKEPQIQEGNPNPQISTHFLLENELIEEIDLNLDEDPAIPTNTQKAGKKQKNSSTHICFIGNRRIGISVSDIAAIKTYFGNYALINRTTEGFIAHIFSTILNYKNRNTK